MFALVLWFWDLSRMARPEQIQVRRVWDESLGLAKRMTVKIELQNFSRSEISAKVTDETPESFGPDLAKVEIVAPAGGLGSGVVSN